MSIDILMSGRVCVSVSHVTRHTPHVTRHTLPAIIMIPQGGHHHIADGVVPVNHSKNATNYLISTKIQVELIPDKIAAYKANNKTVDGPTE